MNAREVLAMARALGLRVEKVRRTGEVRVTLPDGRFVTTSDPSRRKDASKHLEHAVLRVARERGQR